MCIPLLLTLSLYSYLLSTDKNQKYCENWIIMFQWLNTAILNKLNNIIILLQFLALYTIILSSMSVNKGYKRQ